MDPSWKHRQEEHCGGSLCLAEQQCQALIPAAISLDYRAGLRGKG